MNEQNLRLILDSLEPSSELYVSLNEAIDKLFPKGRFARRCDATDKGINEGFVVGDGEQYFANESDLVAYLRRELYSSIDGFSDEFILKESYDNEEYYYTEWESEEEISTQGYYYTADGEEVEINF